MRLSIELFIVFCCVIRLVNTKETFLYEKMNNFGLGNRVIQSPSNINYRRQFDPAAAEMYPKPLPTKRSVVAAIHTPYKSIYQGSRLVNDTRVYRRRFEYLSNANGHRVLCQGMFDCTITHIAIETTDAIPVLLRGGAGYKYFMVIVKARPGDELKGSVRAYCKKKEVEQPLRQEVLPARRYLFDV